MVTPIRKTIFRNDEILSAVERVAQAAAAWTAAARLDSLEVLSVLEGAKPFTRDLAEALGRLCPGLVLKIHGIRSRGTDGTGLLERRHWDRTVLEASGLEGRVVLVVDDLVDSGKTLESLRGGLSALGAREVRTAVLVRKFGEESGPVDFCGFDLELNRREMARQGIKDYWLYGYGMDEDGKSRELDHIGWIEIR